MPILQLRCSLSVAAFLLCVGIGVPPPAAAQSRPPSRASATVAIHQIQVAFIGSGMLGGGTLNYRGATYRFRLGGLGIGGVGVSRLDATGSVYNLRSLADFEGVYGQVRSGWAAGDQGRLRICHLRISGWHVQCSGMGTSEDLDHKSPRLRLDPEPGVTRAAEGIEAGAGPNRRDIQISDAPSVLCLAGPLICIKAEPRRRFYGA